MSNSESQILEKLKAGRNLEIVFKELYDHYYRYCLGLVATIIDEPEEAHDVVQGVFIALYEHKYYKNSKSITALLYMMCQQRAINYLKQKQGEKKKHTDYQQFAISKEIPHFSTEVFQKIDAIVQNMPERMKMIYQAYLARLKHDQIARLYGLNINTVRHYLKLAGHHIKLQLSINNEII